MLVTLRRWLGARHYRYRARAHAKYAATWAREFPGECLHCYFGRWLQQEQGIRLAPEPHECTEQLPRARVL